MTQCEMILAFMANHGSITQLDAETFGCRRLASRICDLKHDGYPIIRQMVDVRCKDGRIVKVARYRMGVTA